MLSFGYDRTPSVWPLKVPASMKQVTRLFETSTGNTKFRIFNHPIIKAHPQAGMCNGEYWNFGCFRIFGERKRLGSEVRTFAQQRTAPALGGGSKIEI